MSKRTIISLSALLILLVGGWVLVDRMGQGIPGFMVWRTISSDAHGGAHVDLGRARLYVETYGKGEPLLILHGGFSSIETMHGQITHFASDRFVIAPDSRGHGRSDPFDGDLHYGDMADDMVALLDHLNIPKADVFGWSDGGNIAFHLAIHHPTRINKIAVFGSNFHHEGLLDSLDDPFADGPESEAAASMKFLYRTLAQDPDRWPIFFEKTMKMWSTEPTFTDADLATIQAPALIMAGEHDLIKPEHLQRMATAIPHARLEILPEEDHFTPMQNPHKVNTLLQGFLSDRAD